MFSLKNKRDQRGFTIVELLIVIVVIGILAALVVTTYSGIQAKARDSKRRTDLQALQTQIEAFYATNNYYPSSAEINDSTWRGTNMKSLSADTMKDPSGTTSTLSTTAASSTNMKVYGYVPTHDDGAACTGTATTPDTACSKYTLTTYLESSKTVESKANLD
jgi:prepilin-type N-terminal cleavage/methylation domain-containing protein